MNAKTRTYVQELMHLFGNIIEFEPINLKKKTQYIIEYNKDEIYKILREQKIGLQECVRHFHGFEEHKKTIINEVFGDNLDNDYKITFEEFLNRGDEEFIFIINKSSKYLELFEKQKKVLEGGNIWNFLNFKKKSPEDIKKNTQTQFLKLLEEEEMYYNELLDLFKEHLIKLHNHREKLEFFESYEKIKNNLKYIAGIVTAIPLGPLEILSGPLWLAYFTMSNYEKNLQDFELWKKTRHSDIVGLTKSLAK